MTISFSLKQEIKEGVLTIIERITINSYGIFTVEAREGHIALYSTFSPILFQNFFVCRKLNNFSSVIAINGGMEYASISQNNPLHTALIEKHDPSVDHTHFYSSALAITPEELECILRQCSLFQEESNHQNRITLFETYKNSIKKLREFVELNPKFFNKYTRSEVDIKMQKELDQGEFNPTARIISSDPVEARQQYEDFLKSHRIQWEQDQSAIRNGYCDADFYCRNRESLDYINQLLSSSLKAGAYGVFYGLIKEVLIHAGGFQEKNARRILSIATACLSLYYLFSVASVLLTVGMLLVTERGTPAMKFSAQSLFFIIGVLGGVDVPTTVLSTAGNMIGSYCASSIFRAYSPAQTTDKKRNDLKNN